MRLGMAARKFERTTIEALNTDSLQFESFPGKINIATTDRLLPNYNNQTRQRMAGHRSNLQWPASRTIRVPATGEIYIVGLTRQDVQGDDAYHSHTILRLVTPADLSDSFSQAPGDTHTGPELGSSGVIRVVRKMPAGPADDPGWLEPKVIGLFYGDTDFSSAVKEPDNYRLSVARFNLYLPEYARLRRYDMVNLGGQEFRVDTPFISSGFSAAQITEQPDDRENLVYVKRSVPRYDPETRRWVEGDREYNVTGTVIKDHSFVQWSEDSQDYYDIVVESEHIGFTPSAGDRVKVRGSRMEVKQVDFDSGKMQYRLRAV